MKPPDPGGTSDLPESMNLFESEVSATQNLGTKRRNEDDMGDRQTKKTITNTELPSASIQNIYCSPSMVIGVKSYKSMDKGPFIVHVTRSEPDLSAGTTIRPIKFGQFLVHNKIQNICCDGVKKVGRNKISVEFKSYEDANKFLDNPILSLSKYEASIPTYNITKMGIVRQVPVDLSMEEFVESIVLPEGCGEILKARRLNRKVSDEGKVSWVPTQTVVLTIHGQRLPARIYLFHTSLQVETYQYPSIQCLNCCRFGHVKAQCRSQPRCYKCAQPHTGESCDVTENQSTCLHCSGLHFSSSKICPELGRQQTIKLLMSQEGISYVEASSRCPKVNRSFAEVAKEIFPPTISQPQTSTPTISHKKTVFTPPRPRVQAGKSYNRQAHQAIVEEVPSSLPNGCAFPNPETMMPQENGLLELLLTLIINILSQNKNPIPSNVAHKLMQVMTISNHNGSNICSSMEQSKPNQEKI